MKVAARRSARSINIGVGIEPKDSELFTSFPNSGSKECNCRKRYRAVSTDEDCAIGVFMRRGYYGVWSRKFGGSEVLLKKRKVCGGGLNCRWDALVEVHGCKFMQAKIRVCEIPSREQRKSRLLTLVSCTFRNVTLSQPADKGAAMTSVFGKVQLKFEDLDVR